MPSYITPKKNTQFIFYLSLVSQADTKLFQSNPTLAAGDVKVSTDGGAFANLGTLPAVTPASGRGVKVTLSAGEMNGDNVLVVFSDAAGAEWCDLSISIQTSTNQIDDLATPAQVNTEVLDVMTVDTLPELTQAIPAATPTFRTAVMLAYMAMRNKFTVSTTARKIHNDAGTAIVSQTISDNGTTYVQDEAVSGP